MSNRFQAFQQPVESLNAEHNLNMAQSKETALKWYHDKKIAFIFSSDFETMFTKHSPREILSLKFEKKTFYLNCYFPF